MQSDKAGCLKTIGLCLAVLAYQPSPVFADECPLPIHRSADGRAEISAAELAAYFARIEPIIFVGRIEAMHFKGYVDGDPVASVQYEILERLRGDLPKKFEAEQSLRCDACTEDDLKKEAASYVGETGIVMGQTRGRPGSAFQTSSCFGLVPIDDFMETGDNLLPALRAAARKPFSPPIKP